MPDPATINPVYYLLALLISTVGAMWKSGRDNRHTLDVIRVQHEVDAADRKQKADLDRSERELAASLIREKLSTDAATTQAQLHVTANGVRDRMDAVAVRADIAKIELRDDTRSTLAAQTVELKAAIEAAKLYTAEKADAAYHESNSVNTKLEKLHEAHHTQGLVLQQLLERLSPIVDLAGPGRG